MKTLIRSGWLQHPAELLRLSGARFISMDETHFLHGRNHLLVSFSHPLYLSLSFSFYFLSRFYSLVSIFSLSFFLSFFLIILRASVQLTTERRMRRVDSIIDTLTIRLYQVVFFICIDFCLFFLMLYRLSF